MSKYNYWNYCKTGSWELMCNFFHNKKNTAILHHSTPLFSTSYNSVGEYYVKQWHYQRGDKLKTWYAIKDFSSYDKIINDCFPSAADMDLPHQWFYESPFKTSRGDYSMKFWGGRKNNKGDGKIDKNPTVFFDCAGDLLQQDLIHFPHVLLGYDGSIGLDDKITQDLENQTPAHIPHNFDEILSEMRKRINIVPYKEDLEGHVRNFLMNALGDAQWMKGQEYYVQECVRRLRNHKKTFHLICRTLDNHNIPYKTFNLDRDQYTDFFDLDNWLPTNKLINDHDTFLDCGMSPRRQRHLPKLIDQVLSQL